MQRATPLIVLASAVSVAMLVATPPADAATTLTVTTTSLPTSDVGVAYGTQLEASGGDGPYSWSTSTPLPAGLTVAVAAPSSPPASYYLVSRAGAVSAYATPGTDVAQTDQDDPARVVAVASDAAGDRYWTVTASGQVIPAFGTPTYGSVGKKH